MRERSAISPGNQANPTGTVGTQAGFNFGAPVAFPIDETAATVLDSSVMDVPTSQIVADIDTDIQGVQLAITAYTLVMAALTLAGAKLGDILGRERTFAIGLGIYGPGSLLTSLSPSLGMSASRNSVTPA